MDGATMSKEEAQKKFEPFLTEECFSCKAPAGVLCDTPAVWIHAVRMIKARHKGEAKI